MNGPPEASLFLGFGLYLAVMLVVGIASVRYMRSLDDFVLGGRRLGPWVAAISERASGESAWFLLGLPGAAYALGFAEFWSVIGIGFGILASWSLIAVGLRRATGAQGSITIPDFLAASFAGNGHVIRAVATVVILVFYTSYVGAQFVGAGKILHATFGLDPQTGMLVGAAVVLAYTVLGGFLAVAWTDLVQGLLMAVVALVLPVLAVIQLGGPGAAGEALAGRGADFLAIDGGQTGRAFLFGVAVGGLAWGLGYSGQPHLLTRYMAIRRPEDLKRGTLIAMSWVLVAYWGAAFIGILGSVVLGPDLADPEQVMPLLARALVPAWLAGIMISGAVAAMMSTADSQLLVATSSLIEDVWVRMIRGGRRPSNPSTLVLGGRICATIITGVALVLAWRGSGFIDQIVSYAWAGLGSSFGPVIVLVLWWPRTSRAGALAGMLTGLVSTLLWRNVPGLQEILDIKAASFLLAFAAVVAGSLLVPGNRVRRFRGEGETA
jgi:sodium/proline symporter